MEIIKLKPIFKDYIWGGENLKSKWGKVSGLNNIAESWELSTHKDGESIIASGKNCGKRLSEILTQQALGENCKQFDRFPILIKLIDAKQKLSVQVHPNDTYALKYENDLGKTEMWHIIDCEKDAGIYLGFNKKTSREEVEQSIGANSIESLLNFIPVKKGDSFLIEAGTIHAICNGVTICEIQQNSNVTYRVYDYDRKDINGNKRELHIAKALDVLSYEKFEIPTRDIGNEVLAKSKYFIVIKKQIKSKWEFFCDDSSFNVLNIIEGSGTVGGVDFKKGETLFIPADYGKYQLIGKCELLLTKIGNANF